MKRRLTSSRSTILASTLLGISFLGLGGCKDKPADPKKAAEEAAEAVSSNPTVELDSSGFNSQRSQAFGFLSRMPATTEAAFGIRNLSDVASALIGSQTFQKAMALAAQSGGEVDLQTVEMGQAMLDQYVGKELFVIFSGGSATQFQNLQQVFGLISEMNMRSAGEVAAGNGTMSRDPMEPMIAAVRAGFKTPGSPLSKAMEELKVPPMILGSKISDGADEIVATLHQLEENFPPVITVGKFQAGGGNFTSWKIHLQDVLNEGMEAELDEAIGDPATSKKIIEIFRKKTIEVSFGVVDNYLLVTLGGDHSHLKFAESPEESILAAKSFGFADQFLSKKLVGYSFASQPFLKGGTSGGSMIQMANSFADGLSGGAGETAEMGKLIRKLGGQMEKLGKRESQTQVGVTLMDNGLRGESIGGYRADVVDSKAMTQFANRAPADAAMVFGSVANPEYRDDSVAVLETLFALGDVIIEARAKNAGEEQLGEMKKLFAPDLAKIWGILKDDFIDGIGSQTGIIVDLKGGMPKIPGAPNAIINNGKVPRIAIAMDVADRAKLSAAWDELVPAVNAAMLKVPGTEPGSEPQLPDVVTDEGGGLQTHYMSLPFMSNDFVPSLSLNDELFFLSTSKTFVQGIAATPVDTRKIRGTYMMMDFTEIQRYASEWLGLLEQNSDTVFGESEAQQFQEQAAQAKQVMEFTKALQTFRFNRYQNDEGAMRSSWHLKLQDIE